ncbi:MAG: hypothetical protein QOH60_297 [Mycobacterium sp.]|nr:hypothetical protein [Mycobacterium sp.]
MRFRVCSRRTSLETHQRQVRRDLARPRPRQPQLAGFIGGSDRQQTGGQLQPGAGVCLHDIRGCPTSMLWSRNTLHRNERRDPHLNACSWRRRGQRACGQPDREGELPTRGHREGTVTQPIRYSQYRGAGLCWVGGAASGHCRPIVAPMRACAKSKGPGTLTSTELQVLPWRHDLQTTRDRVPPQR